MSMNDTQGSMLDAILKLKRTLVPGTPGPMGWREIGRRLGMSGQLAHHHSKKIKDRDKRCPTCLRKLEREKTDATETGT